MYVLPGAPVVAQSTQVITKEPEGGFQLLGSHMMWC